MSALERLWKDRMDIYRWVEVRAAHKTGKGED